MATTTPTTLPSTARPAAGGTGAATASGAAARAGSQLSGTVDNFLTLLTTQLKNQSPTDPLDTNEMTAQLVQFATAQQQVEMNRNLEQLVALQQVSQLTAAAPIMGRQVEVQGTTLPLQEGKATVRLPAAGAARIARVAVLDSGGRVLREQQVTLGSQSQDWVWDGIDRQGARRPDGAYRVAVTGADAAGGSAAVGFTVLGTATSAERANGSLMLRMGAASYGFDNVRSIGR